MDLKPYFRSRIDWHVNGLGARTQGYLPPEVAQVKGDVTDREITVHLKNGEQLHYRGGRYSVRKINGCYAPLMPIKIKSV